MSFIGTVWKYLDNTFKLDNHFSPNRNLICYNNLQKKINLKYVGNFTFTSYIGIRGVIIISISIIYIFVFQRHALQFFSNILEVEKTLQWEPFRCLKSIKIRKQETLILRQYAVWWIKYDYMWIILLQLHYKIGHRSEIIILYGL